MQKQFYKEETVGGQNVVRHRGHIVIDHERCKGCALCVESCPKNIISLSGNKVNAHGYPYAVAADMELCIGCASCGIVCPDACITVYRV